MVDVKQAVESATAFISQMYHNAYGQRLEEVELNDAGPGWSVVISFEYPGNGAGLDLRVHRLYKKIEVDDVGRAVKLKMFTV